jgi:hypothetical protein
VTWYDTTIAPLTVYDTTVVPVTVFDSTLVPIHDTLEVADTILLTQYDTVTIYDTIIIHDTIVVGIDDVEIINAKIYTSNGQIVVEDADGRQVTLYDVSGRMLPPSVTTTCRYVSMCPP